jgi:NhaP-type Na+/H+ or K+/H+ antiporter
MENTALLFLTLGGLFLAGLVADLFGRRTRLPRVTLLLLIGIAVGPSGLALIPGRGGRLVRHGVDGGAGAGGLPPGQRAHGRETGPPWARDPDRDLRASGRDDGGHGSRPDALRACARPRPDPRRLATATDPAATTDAIAQARATGPFTDRLRGIVAVDDASGLIVFSLVLLAVAVMGGNGSEATAASLREGARELGGSLLVGLATGLPAALLTGRLTRGEPLQSEALGTVFLTAGLAIWLDVSPLLAGITAGPWWPISHATTNAPSTRSNTWNGPSC